MRRTTSLILLGFLLGCAPSTIVIDRDDDGIPELTMEQHVVGRGCIAVDANDSAMSVLVAQDGTSDWSISRLLSSLGSIVGSVFGGQPDDMTAGSTITVCDKLFYSPPEPSAVPL